MGLDASMTSVISSGVIPHILASSEILGSLEFVLRKFSLALITPAALAFMLLLTFVCFFVISENLGRTEAVRDFLQKLLAENTLLTSAGTSQIISNVPAAVLLSGFTEDWRSLLAGVNIGGLGTPVASLASLITLKLYMASPRPKVMKFLGIFTLANIAGLAILLLFSSII